MDIITAGQVDSRAAGRAESGRAELERKLSALEPPATREEVDFIIRQQESAYRNFFMYKATGRRSFLNATSLDRSLIANPDSYLLLRRALDPAFQNKAPNEPVSTSQE